MMLWSTHLNGKQLDAWDCACDYFGESNVEMQPVGDFFIGDDYYYRIKWPIALSYKEAMEFVDRKKPVSIIHARTRMHLFIHWEQVTVENEHGNTVNIRDLFCRVYCSRMGVMADGWRGVGFMRTTFTEAQWNVGYVHSHSQFNYSRPVSFGHVCLGSGPINNTIRTLCDLGISDSLRKDLTNLFMWELDKVAHVESLAGVPYIRMESIAKQLEEVKADRVSLNMNTLNFVKSYVKATDVPIGFSNGEYILGCTLVDFAVSLTNYYYKYMYAMQRAHITYATLPLTRYLIKNDRCYLVKTRNARSYTNAMHDPANTFRFRGKDYRLTVTDEKDKDYRITLIDFSTVNAIKNVIIEGLNKTFIKIRENEEGLTEKDKKAIKELIRQQPFRVGYACEKYYADTLTTEVTPNA